MICMNYDHNKKFGLSKFHSGYGKFNLNSPKGYSLKIINAQTVSVIPGFAKEPVIFIYQYIYAWIGALLVDIRQ